MLYPKFVQQEYKQHLTIYYINIKNLILLIIK